MVVYRRMVSVLMVKTQTQKPLWKSTLLVSFSVPGINAVSETAGCIVHSSLGDAREGKRRVNEE